VIIAVAGDGADDGVCGLQLGSSFGDLSCEIGYVMMYDVIVFAWALFYMVFAAGSCCPRLRRRERQEGWCLVKVLIDRPGWIVMPAERIADQSVASFGALETRRC
jgi:hypothetical protein